MATDPPFLTLHLLGDPVLLGPDGPVRGRAAYKRRIALLAILGVARGRPVGRERLLGLLWPEQPAESARHVLSETLYVLRKELGEDAVVPVGGDVALGTTRVGTDVEAFERALEEGRREDAAAAYRGPLLDGFYVADAPEFDRWVDGERDRLARLFARALEELASAAEAGGDPLRAADAWARLAAHDPFSSRVALRLVRALDAAGERARALRAADAHAALMRAELEVEPDGELLDFVERLRTEPPRRSPAPPPPGASDRPSAESRPAPVAPAEPRMTVDAVAPAPSVSTGDAVASPDSGAATDASVDTQSAGRTAGPDAGDARLSMDGGISGDGWASVDGGAAAGDGVSVDAASRLVDGRLTGTVGGSSAEARRVGGGTGGGGRTRRWRRAGVVMAAAAGVVLGLAAALGVERREPTGATAAADAPKYDPRRIAVLYFDDHTPGGGLGYLANGLTEMLLHDLAQVEALDVVPRNGVKPFRDHPVPFDSMAAMLRAGSVVEGSVQKSGDSVRVTVQLIDANSERHLDSRVIVRPLRDLFALEDTLAEEVASALRQRLGQEIRMRETRAETHSDRALALLLQAKDAHDEAKGLARQADPTDAAGAAPMLARADSLLARAMDADPAWTRPVVERGWVAVDLAGLKGEPAAVRPAISRANDVLSKAPNDAEALELKGAAEFLQAVLTRGGDPSALMDASERDLGAATAAEPGLASAWARLSQVLRARGKLAEGDVAARRALKEDAYLVDAADVLLGLYNSAVMRGALPEAGETCGDGARRYPADWRFVECRLTLMREDRGARPDPDAAWKLVARLDAMDPPERARAEGRAYSPLYRQALAAAIVARAGLGDSARAVLARVRRAAGADPEMRVDLDYDEAYVRMVLGEQPEARRLVAELLAARPALRSYLRRDPLLRGLLTPAGAAPAASAGNRAGGAR